MTINIAIGNEPANGVWVKLREEAEWKFDGDDTEYWTVIAYGIGCIVIKKFPFFHFFTKWQDRVHHRGRRLF